MKRDTPHADLWFSKITIAQFVYWVHRTNDFKDLFETIPDYRTVVLLMPLINSGVQIVHECRLLKNHNNPLCLEFRKILFEQNEEDLNCIRKEETIIETISNK